MQKTVNFATQFNTMRKIYFLLLTIISIQTTAQTKISIQGGINLNSITWKDKDNANVQPDSSDYSYSKTSGNQGYHAGINFLFHTEENWYLETGLWVTKKGGKTEETTKLNPGNTDFKRTQLFSPAYLQIPFYLVYLPEIKKKYKITAGAGIHFGFGVGGNYESSTNINNGATVKVDRKARFGIGLTDDFMKMEIGYGAKLGFVMSDNLFFNLSFQRSLVNNTPKVNERNSSSLHNVIGLSVGKFLKR
jgi:hypothetical protein